MADKVKVNVGDVVKVTMSNSDMQDKNGYRGELDKGMVTTIRTLYPDNSYLVANDREEEFNLGTEEGAPFWMKKSFFEVLEETPFEDENLEIGQVWAYLNDKDKAFTKGKLYEVVPATCSCCTYGIVADAGGRPCTPRDSLTGFALVTDAPVAEVEDLPPVLTAVSPLTFDNMSDDERGMLLLDQHEGKTMQYFHTFAEGWLDMDSEEFDGGTAYRTKPQALIDAEDAFKTATARTETLKGELEALAATL